MRLAAGPCRIASAARRPASTASNGTPTRLWSPPSPGPATASSPARAGSFRVVRTPAKPRPRRTPPRPANARPLRSERTFLGSRTRKRPRSSDRGLFVVSDAVASDSFPATGDEAHHQQDQENDEQHIGDVHRKTRDTTRAKGAGDEGEHEKDKGPAKHRRSSRIGFRHGADDCTAPA